MKVEYEAKRRRVMRGARAASFRAIITRRHPALDR